MSTYTIFGIKWWHVLLCIIGFLVTLVGFLQILEWISERGVRKDIKKEIIHHISQYEKLDETKAHKDVELQPMELK